MDVQGEYICSSLEDIVASRSGRCWKMLLAMSVGVLITFAVKRWPTQLLGQNKAAFKKYVESFEEGRHVVALKKKQREHKEAKNQCSSKQPSQSSASKQVVSPLAAGLASRHITTEKYLSRVASSAGVAKFNPPSLYQREKGNWWHLLLLWLLQLQELVLKI